MEKRQFLDLHKFSCSVKKEAYRITTGNRTLWEISFNGI